MKRVAIVAAHFVPSNLASVHRARLWSLHLREFGWEPVIVTAHPDYYEEPLEPELEELLPANLKVIRTKAIPVKPLRIIGDLGIRAFFWHYRELVRLADSHEIDFLHITIPSNFSAPLGQLVHQRTGLAYGIDYIDPWVQDRHGDRAGTKAWLSGRLAKILEPIAVKRASLITGINPLYYEGMLQRNPRVRAQAVLASMPYGASELDHRWIEAHPRQAHLFDAHIGKFNMIYAGAMLPKAYVVLEKLLDGIAKWRVADPALATRFHVHFVGTGKSVNDPAGFNIKPFIDGRGLNDCVSEYPQRLPYLDVLTHLHAASGILILGSTEAHYSPSKVFQALLSRRPLFAVLHERSSALNVLREAGAQFTLPMPDGVPPSAEIFQRELQRFVAQSATVAPAHLPEQYTARSSARALAEALSAALAKHG